mgnify:FL=1
MKFRTITPIQKRFNDMDCFQHINNVCQQMYFDVAKSEFLAATLQGDAKVDRMRVLTVATNTSYMAQVRFDDDTYVTTECESIGNKSFTLLQRIYDRREGANPTIKTESRSVMVAFDFEAQESVVVPDEWRERLSK